MNRLAELTVALANAPHSAARQAWLTEYFNAHAQTACWSDLGFATGWLLGTLKPPRLTPAKQVALAAGKVDEELHQLSIAAIGDGAEATALAWPGSGDLSVSDVVANISNPTDLFDRLDTPARIALSNLYAGRKVKGVRFNEVRTALAALIDGDPALVAGALAAEAPPYTKLTQWLSGGPAPTTRPPTPPNLTAATAIDPQAGQWPLPAGQPVAYANGVAFSADGEITRLDIPSGTGWGFAHKKKFTDFTTPPSPLTAEQAQSHSGVILQKRGADWSIVVPERKFITCAALYVEIGRNVNLTAAITIEGEDAPLTKAPCPPEDQAKVIAFARRNTLEKFGPVRRVGPGLSVTLSFAGTTLAPRRKCGLTLIAPQIEEIIWDETSPLTLAALEALIK
jgi:hypothetical protein